MYHTFTPKHTHMTKQGEELSERLKNAFNAIPNGLKASCEREYCKQFRVVPDTFQAKRYGKTRYKVTIEEVRFVERYYVENVLTKLIENDIPFAVLSCNDTLFTGNRLTAVLISARDAEKYDFTRNGGFFEFGGHGTAERDFEGADAVVFAELQKAGLFEKIILESDAVVFELRGKSLKNHLKQQREQAREARVLIAKKAGSAPKKSRVSSSAK